MSYASYQARLQHQIRKYNAKSGAGAVAGMYSVYDPNVNLSIPNFAWNLDLNLKIHIDIKIGTGQGQKALYGTARYGIDVYDPVTILGVLTPDSLTKWFMLEMVRHFVAATGRGYKYQMSTSLALLYAELPILETFAKDSLWYTRMRKIDATRNFTAFYDLAFFDVNSFPTEPYHDSVMGDMDSEMLIRQSDMLQCIFDIAVFDQGIFDYTPYSLLHLDNIFANDHRQNNISANFFDTALFDRAPFSGEGWSYPELYLLAPCPIAYVPVFDVANYDYDVFYADVYFDEDLVTEVMARENQSEQANYRELIQFTGSDRMHTMYGIHAAFQVNRQFSLQQILNANSVQGIIVPQYHAFLMEYSYKKMALQLVDKEMIIQKYIRLGLDESILRKIAVLGSR